MNHETVQSRYKMVCRFFRTILRMDHEQHMRKTGAEIGSVRRRMAIRFRIVHIVTFGTVQLDCTFARHVGHSCAWDGREIRLIKNQPRFEQNR